MIFRRKTNFGFTLVELLVAAAITVLIVVMLGWMLGSLMRTASYATQRVDAFRDARAALQMIEGDLRNLVRTQWNPDPFANPTPCPAGTPTTTPCPAATTSQQMTLPAAYFALKNIYTADPAAGNQQLYALVSAKIAGSPTPAVGDVSAV